MEIPDHPDIRKMELYGTLNPEEEVREPECPVCGAVCETIYCDPYGSAVGCDQCISPRDAYEYMEEENEE